MCRTVKSVSGTFGTDPLVAIRHGSRVESAIGTTAVSTSAPIPMASQRRLRLLIPWMHPAEPFGSDSCQQSTPSGQFKGQHPGDRKAGAVLFGDELDEPSHAEGKHLGRFIACDQV